MATHAPSASASQSSIADRRAWMATLAKADPRQLESLWDTLGETPAHTLVRPPERGSVMVRGRVGGGGAAFNMGEITVTRCTARLEDGALGHAYIPGRKARHAEIAAVLDAMLQTDTHADAVRARILAPLAATREAAQRDRAAKVAATKVNFFTMVRGDN